MKIINSELKGSVLMPPSKSMAHRAIICGSLAKGESCIRNVTYSDDIRATIDAMKCLGSSIREEGSSLFITGTQFTNISKEGIIDCGESGSTLRFLIPIALLQSQPVRFTGRGKLGTRPLDPYYDIFREHGITYTKQEHQLNLQLKGLLKAGTFRLRGDISSQFISGLCFALPLLKEDSIIEIEGVLESQSYIEMTLQSLALFGIEVSHQEYRKFIVKGNQQYHPCNYSVEGDFSQSAFFFVMGALGKGLELKGLDKNSKQGDKEVIDILRRMGAVITEQEDGYSVKPSQLKGTSIDATNCPDIIPVLAAAAACAEGKTEIINAKRLRIKECDRLSAITSELNKIGAKITEFHDSLIIEGVSSFTGGAVSSWDDHRIAMSLASIAQKCTVPLELDNPHCVAKSFPNFWQVYESLGGSCHP